MKIFKSKKQILKEECWDLRSYLIKWINEHFTQYLSDASKSIDLGFHTHTYRGKEYTQREIIEKIIELSNVLITNNNEDEVNWLEEEQVQKWFRELEKSKNQLFQLLSLVYWEMWW